MAKAGSLLDTEWELPRLRTTLRVDDDFEYFTAGENYSVHENSEVFDVKFYPYSPEGAPPVFAAATKSHVLVCRLVQVEESTANPVQVVKFLRDADEDTYIIAVAWSKDPVTEDPWLLVAGDDSKIKVWDIKQGKTVKTLVGHGSAINDLAMMPNDSELILSVSDDFTSRLWSLRPENDKQPTMVLFGGEVHKWNILSAAFHQTGRYVVTAGHDQAIAVWAVPQDQHLHKPRAQPTPVYYPHFYTCEVHSGIVDCVTFYGDLVMSRACYEERIVLWRIEGFNSNNDVIPYSETPTNVDPNKLTRSAFFKDLTVECPTLWTRLIQFYTPDCGSQFFNRFKVFQAPGKHSVLAFANAKNKALIWDLDRLVTYHKFILQVRNPRRDRSVPVERPAWLTPKRSRARVKSHGQDSEGGPSPDMPFDRPSLKEWDKMYDISVPHHSLQAHKMVATSSMSASDEKLVGRQVAWSPEGDWLVIAGNSNRIVICSRWAKSKAGQGMPTPRPNTPWAGITPGRTPSVWGPSPCPE